jgi:replicative DNA helicase
LNGEKLPPHDASAEEAVNGSLLIDATSIHKIADLLEAQDFYYEQNRLIYEACLSLYERNEAINQITVAQDLDRRQKLDACGGAAYLSHLISTCPTSLDIEAYAGIVYRLSVMRHLISAAGQIAAIGYEADTDVDTSLNRAEESLFKLRHRQGSRDLIHIRQVLDKYFENISPTPDEEAGIDRIPHVLSGFNKLDEFLGGFQRSDLVIIAGRPSMGKTSFTLGIARNAAVNMGANVAIFSLEMASDSLVQRLLSSESDIESRRIRWGGIHSLGSERDEKRLMEATGRLSESHIYLDDSPMLRILELRSKARRLHFELGGLDLIVVDYLQLLQGDVRRTENRVQEISYISR